ncbi:response regulator [Flavobacterium sp.]|uniref:response regulator n=1 Tax=Flavobacterium sp. TaxID=239 RepID=UPI002B4B4FCB|nr:response regulator [Flavobacterium sp.]HLF52652.1 response regulator [Flavobacterium sp.]
MKLKILMVDDHPSMIEGYKIILSYNDLGFEIETTAAHNCENAFEIITNTTNLDFFDLVFLDYSLPPFEAKNISSGEDLAMLVKTHLPNSKIVMLTSHTEALILYNIIRNVEPEGLLVKSDFSAEELISAFDIIMRGEIYHSLTVKQNVKELLSKKVYLDHFNRQIITLLAQGIKTKSLPAHLNLSISAIEKRKVQIRDYFCVQKGNDEDIIREARKLGII